MNDPASQKPLFDHALLRAHYTRALKSGHMVDFLQQEAATEIADRLCMVKRDFKTGVDLFSQRGLLTKTVRDTAKVKTITGCESRRTANPEILSFAAQSLDLVVSALAMQWANDLPGLLIQINRALKPDGLFLGALLGSATLNELRASFTAAEEACEGGISPRIIPLADIRQMGALLQRAGFAMPVADRDVLKVSYASPLALMRELRLMGGANAMPARRKTPLRRKTLRYAVDYYLANYGSDDGRITATFEIIYLSGWHPVKSA